MRLFYIVVLYAVLNFYYVLNTDFMLLYLAALAVSYEISDI